MLRNGNKAYVRHHETELGVDEIFKLLGYAADGEQLSWCDGGNYYTSGGARERDIIGMYPETRIINGFEVPVPETEAPEYDASYYLAAPTRRFFHGREDWVGDTMDKIWLKRGLVFLSEKDAIANAKAMLGVDPHSEDES